MLYRVIVAFDGTFDLAINAQSKEEAEDKARKLVDEDYDHFYDHYFAESASVSETYVAD